MYIYVYVFFFFFFKVLGVFNECEKDKENRVAITPELV